MARFGFSWNPLRALGALNPARMTKWDKRGITWVGQRHVECRPSAFIHREAGQKQN